MPRSYSPNSSPRGHAHRNFNSTHTTSSPSTDNFYERAPTPTTSSPRTGQSRFTASAYAANRSRTPSNEKEREKKTTQLHLEPPLSLPIASSSLSSVSIPSLVSSSPSYYSSSHVPSTASIRSSTPVSTHTTYTPLTLHTPIFSTTHLSSSPPVKSPRYRDSFSSILNDAFFQDYVPILQPFDNPAFEASPTNTEGSPWLQQGDENTPMAVWPPPRRESLTIGPSQYWNNSPVAAPAPAPAPAPPPVPAPVPVPALKTKRPSDMEAYNIALIGGAGVGKSTFVQRVLGLSKPPSSNASSVRMILDNVAHMVTLLELDLEYFELSPSQPIQWPKQINGHIVPRVDAAMVLYDVMNQETIRELPQTLAALTNSKLPAILVANKCEHPRNSWQVDADSLAKHKYFEACVGTYQVSADIPDTGRACLQGILKAAVLHRREEMGETIARRRAQSNLEAQESNPTRPQMDQYGHSRASSEFSLLRGFGNSAMNERPPSRSPLMSQQSIDSDNRGHQSYNDMMRSSSGIRIDKPSHERFHDVDEPDVDPTYNYGDDIPILQRGDDTGMGKSSKIAGVAFEELVDRLLAPRLSRADHNFLDVFLCLYRKFAAPSQLFSAILCRLEQVREDNSIHYLTKTRTQLRMVEVTVKWVTLYPGDFARPATRRNLEEFIRHLSTEPIFSTAGEHMRQTLQLHVIEDDDTGWANADELGDRIAGQGLERDRELAVGVSGLQFDDDTSGRPSSCSGSTSSGQLQFNSYEYYERQAALLVPSDQLPMNKFRYNILMDIPDDDVADELTRIDWVMFSSIRIRDFVRHVSLPAEQKEKCKSLRNVNRMISHFNHIAQWVANLILLRDKAKHRALMLEKFMNIALKLRQLNNYNGLAAVLAGINGIAIHRLTQTRALVPADVQKRFARLVILMGTQKSHFAYRLAWENSPLPRIPFMPLHRRDLVSAEEGSKTFVGPNNDRINWKKFEVLGEVLLPIMKSQSMVYPKLSKSDSLKELILCCRMPTDDEEIYQRSVQLENGSNTEPSRKKSFPWFAGK